MGLKTYPAASPRKIGRKKSLEILSRGKGTLKAFCDLTGHKKQKNVTYRSTRKGLLIKAIVFPVPIGTGKKLYMYL